MTLIYILIRLGNFTITIIAVNLELAIGYGLLARGYSVLLVAPNEHNDAKREPRTKSE